MKKIKFVITIFMLFLLTGCIDYNNTMTINDDKSVDFQIEYSSKFKLINNSDKDEDYIDENLVIKDNYEEKIYEDEEKIEEIDEEEKEKNDILDKYSSVLNLNEKSFDFLKKHGYNIEFISENRSENGYAKVFVFKKFSSLDDITSDSKISINFTDMYIDESNFNDSKLFYRIDNTYNASFIFNFQVKNDKDEIVYDDSSNFNATYSISFPDNIKYIKSNATKTSNNGKTLTWILKSGKINNVDFSFSFEKQMSEFDKIIIYICLGIIGISILLIIIVSLTKLGKKKIEVEVFDDENKNS